jgi:hypothetical protein
MGLGAARVWVRNTVRRVSGVYMVEDNDGINGSAELYSYDRSKKRCEI